MNNQLFRQEVIDSRKTRNLGLVSINIPVNYYVVSLGSVLITILIFIFIYFAEYSEKYVVSGYLDNSRGIVEVYPSQSGLIIKSEIKNHQHVSKGDVLFQVDTSYAHADSQSQIVARLNHQKKRINQDIIREKKELAILNQLRSKKFITAEVLSNKKAELHALLDKRNQLEIELIQLQKMNAYLIRAPIDGVLSSVNYKLGQYVDTSVDLVKIIPDNTELMAEILVPVRQSGFLSPNEPISLHYDAYPYERFGTYRAVIKDIDPVISLDNTNPFAMKEPYYKVKAVLNSQFVTVYGRQKTLQQGMTFSAVLMGTRRKVWQWIWEPINRLIGS